MRIVITSLTYALIFARIAAAEPQAVVRAPEPRVCIGYDPVHLWNNLILVNNVAKEAYCFEGYAFLAHDVAGGRWFHSTNQSPIAGYCCPLPEGVLTSEHVFVDAICPDNFVATGARTSPESPSIGKPAIEIRCTKIDTHRYYLESATEAWNVGWLNDLTGETLDYLRGGTRQQTTRNLIPAGLRYGLLRHSQTLWNISGCVGYPWGSVLVGRVGGSGCSGYRFRQVFLRGNEGLRSGQPLQIFPNCRALDNPFKPDASCMRD